MKRSPRNRLVALALGLAALACAAAPATAGALQIKHMRLKVQVTGIHVVRWHLTEGAFPDPNRTWVDGRGTQTLGFSDPRPVTYLADAFVGKLPGGAPTPPLSMVPLRTPAPLRASLRRKASWSVNDPVTCEREGGCEGEVPVLPLHHKPSCPAKRVALPVQVESKAVGGGAARALTVSFQTASLEGLWPNCPPDIDGAKRPLTLAQPHAVAIAGAVKQIVRLEKGDSVSLNGSYRRGAVDGAEQRTCPKLSGSGQQECAVTEVTVEVTRTR